MIITFQDSHSPLHDRACRTVFVRVVLLIAVALFPSAALGQRQGVEEGAMARKSKIGKHGSGDGSYGSFARLLV